MGRRQRVGRYRDGVIPPNSDLPLAAHHHFGGNAPDPCQGKAPETGNRIRPSRKKFQAHALAFA